MSHQANDYVKKLFRDRVTRRQKLLLWSLADYHNTARRAAWPSMRTLAEESLMDIRECRRVLDELEEAGLVERIKGGEGAGDFNEYRLIELDGKGGHITPLNGPDQNSNKDGQKDGRKGGQKDGRTAHAIRKEREREPERSTHPYPPFQGGTVLTVRDRRHLNAEIFAIMQDNVVPFEEALKTACARLLIPVEAAQRLVTEAGLGDSL